MEIVDRTDSVIKSKRAQSSSFECEPAIIDSILGLKSLGHRNIRIDYNVFSEGLTPPQRNRPKVSFARRPTRRCTETFGHKTRPRPELSDQRNVPEIDASLQRERLLRLLDRQQAWYDAAQQAAQAAEQLLLLCEQHQQPWLLPATCP